MTVGGKTKGILTRVSAIGFILERVYASQYDNGIEMINNKTVVINASLKVSKSGFQSIILTTSIHWFLPLQLIPFQGRFSIALLHLR